MKRYSFTFLLSFILFVALIPVLVSGQSTDTYADAVGQANLRARPDVNSAQVGAIEAGTLYPVIGRSEFYPWILLGDADSAQPIGWVYDQLVTVHGSIYNVPVSVVDVSAPPLATPTALPIVTVGTVSTNSDGSAPVVTPFFTPTPRYSVIGVVSGEINIRYGPGTDYPPVGRAFAGESLQLTGYHTQFPWVQLRWVDSPNGFAWVHQDVIEIQGDIYSLPAVTAPLLNLPTLTPTAAVRQSSNRPGGESVELSAGFAALSDRIWNTLLEGGFVPGTSRFGALYLHDLQTGEAITFGNEIAFNGTSVTKIAILTQYYGIMNGQTNWAEGIDIPKMMICSSNEATNRMLSVIGNGNEYLGAETTTEFLQELGVENTFITAPYYVQMLQTPTPYPYPVSYPVTSADQGIANPSPTNQMTVEEMGWLLSNIYECAYNESGPLIDDFDGVFRPQECRKILHVMSNNTVDSLLRSGVPANIRVAHKHGYVDDTHGNAAVFFTPGGDYVMVMMLHETSALDGREQSDVFLNFETYSLPVFSEVSRIVYNYYNPAQPMATTRGSYIPDAAECDYNGESPLVAEIVAPQFLLELDESQYYNIQPTITPTVTSGG
jgi:uncharacterized protein YraI/beta-lactamase class A